MNSVFSWRKKRLRQIEIIYSTNILELEDKINKSMKIDNNVIDVKLSVGFFGYYCVVMKEIEK